MADHTGIEWADATVNFWWGCSRVSPGCQHCYAETLAHRRHFGWGPKAARVPVGGAFALAERVRRRAIREGKRLRIFTNSMSDFFDEKSPPGIRRRAWETIEFSPEVDWLILTKRPENIAGMLPAKWGAGWPHVWLGVSAENQEWADKRIPILLKTPAAVRFVSYEPALGPVNFYPWLRPAGKPGVCYSIDGDLWHTLGSCQHCSPALDWIIVGGESGPGSLARAFDIQWARSVISQTAATGVACFVKQLGTSPFASGDYGVNLGLNHALQFLRGRKGGDIDRWPQDLRVREFPCAR